jgi:hypothetical protein
LDDRGSLLERVVRFELPIEDSIAMLRAYGWNSDQELVILSAADAGSSVSALWNVGWCGRGLEGLQLMRNPLDSANGVHRHL